MAALAYILLLSIVALGVPLALSLRGRVNAEVRSQARGQADLVAATAADLLPASRRPELRTLAAASARQVHGRVVIVDVGARVLVDSAGSAEVGTSYASRPEIRSALAGRPAQLQRASTTLDREIMATSIPIIREGHVRGAVRVTQSIAAVHSAVLRVELELAVIGAVVLLLGLAAGGFLAARVARPVTELERTARAVTGGDLEARARVDGSREQRSLARSFNEMTARINRLLEAQTQFVADASHQLRTPLTGLRLRLEAARDMSYGRASQGELDAAIDEVDRLAHTVEELLLLSRAGERQDTGERLDLGAFATRAAQRWTPAAQAANIGVEYACERERAVAWCAAADLDRALDALIENAIQYATPGTSVQVVAQPGAIEIRDRGSGIDGDDPERLFERFHRGRAGRGGPRGTGLGLAIARELAREWRGDVELVPRPGGGTIARLTLPDAGRAAEDFAPA